MDGFTLWLMQFVASDHDISAYTRLFSELQSIPFVAVMPRDNDRIGDAELQRMEFMNEAGISLPVDISSGPSVLEVLVALARKLDDLIGYPESSPERWFWYMLSSIGLVGYEDHGFVKEAVDEMVRRFLNREYAPDGKGGCCYFPCGKDLREVDIWYQWMWFLNSLEEFKTEDI